MKNIIMILAIFSFIGMNAQEKPKEVVKESKTKIIKVKVNGKIVEKKIKVSTTKTNDVSLKASDSNKTNQSRNTDGPVKVSKEIMIDNDDDMSFDEKVNYSYVDYNGDIYNFTPMNNGFAIENSVENSLMANARKSINKDFYMINTDEYSGIGYFKGNKFVIEYYDKDEDILVVEEYNREKMSKKKMDN
ncbi:hypothetical protein [Winogradskyella sp. A3E31]|uniref:hypothetical protein n=1 Tax=Winogradskyella sp. A3E31 TaxID=3349637 RepID=UPI00398AADC3